MAATPIFSPTGGIYTTDQTVTISDSTSGATIYYTTDGTVPTTSSNVYSGSISVSGNGSVKSIIAMAAASGSTDSGLAAASFKVSHVISTVAGKGTYGFSGDGAASTNAEFRYPSGIAVDSSGNYYVADAYNYRVRKISSIGTITTIAGNGSYGNMVAGTATSSPMRQPVAVALDAGGANLYIADAGSNAVYKVTGLPNGPYAISLFAGSATGVSGFSGDGGGATSALLNWPSGVAVSGSTVYIADSSNNVVRAVSGGNINAFAGNNAAGPGFAGDGSPAGIAQLNNPTSVAVDSSGRVLIADQGNNRVRRVSTLGTITTVAGGPNNAPQWQDGGLAAGSSMGVGTVAADGAGNFYVVSYSYVIKVDSAGYGWRVAGGNNYGVQGDGGPAASAYLNMSTYSGYPSTVAVDSVGGIYITETYNYVVRKVQ
jgi:hypothetical protein